VSKTSSMGFFSGEVTKLRPKFICVMILIKMAKIAFIWIVDQNIYKKYLEITEYGKL
jgi:hypothetical protein